MGSDVVIGDDGSPPLKEEPQAEPEPEPETFTDEQIEARKAALAAYLKERE